MDTRRLILLFTFSFSLVLLWEAWQAHKNPPPLSVTESSATNAPATDPATPSLSADLRTTEGKKTVSPAATRTQASALSAGDIIRIRTDLYEAQVSTLGGGLVRLELLKHHAYDKVRGNLVLLGEEHQYTTQSGLIGAGMPNHKSLFRALPGPRELSPGTDEIQLVLETTSEAGVRMQKTLRFKRGSYLIEQHITVENGSADRLLPNAYFQIQRDSKTPEGESFFLVTFTGPAFYTGAGKFKKVAFDDVLDGDADFQKRAQDGWVAMVQHYFVTAWLPQGDTPREFYINKLDGDLYAFGVILPMSEIAPGDKAGLTIPLYSGPQEQSTLKTLAPGLDLVVDYGWLTVVAAPIFWVLEWLHKWVGNWGWAIVLLTVLIKAIFYPLSAASYKSMARMKAVSPRLMQLKERYGEDKQRLNKEMMKLYQTEKINPLGGCLPIVVQIPVFIALYWALLGAVEMRGAPWMLHIKDLSTPDPYYILPVVMTLTMFLQTRLNPTPPDPMQAKLMMILPLVFGVTFFFFPAGLVLYWVVNNVLSIAQQWQITRMIEGAKKQH